MIIGNMVKIRTKRYFDRQPLWVIVGKVLDFSGNWVKIEGKGIGFFQAKVDPIDVDTEIRVLLLPKDNIAHIRILPDDYDLKDVKVERVGFRYYIKIKGAPDASLGEVAEKT